MKVVAEVRRYRPRLVIEAAQLTWDNAEALAEWSGGEVQRGVGRLPDRSPDLWIALETKDGKAYIRLGDWIIRGIGGVFFPCKGAEFNVIYEPVEKGELP